jgi:hypothetical protein
VQGCCFLGSKPVDCCLLAMFKILQAEWPLHNISFGLAAKPPHGNIFYGLAAAPPHGNINFLFASRNNQFFFRLLMATSIFYSPHSNN